MLLSAGLKPSAHRRVSHGNVVTSVAFAPDGQALASGSWDGTVRLWDVSDGTPKLKRTFRGLWDEVDAIAFAPDGSAIAGAGMGFGDAPFSLVTLWTLDSARGRSLIQQPGKIDALAFSPDGATLAIAGGDRRAVTLWDAATGQERGCLPDHCGPVWSVAYAPDGATLAVASGTVPAVAEPCGDPAGEVRLWDVSGRRPRPRARLMGHEHGAVSVAFSPDGTSLASGGFDRVAKVWGVEARREWATLDGHDGWVAAVAYSPDGTLLATGSHDQTIKLWDLSTGCALATLAGHTGNVYSVAFSPDGAWLASGSLDRTVRLWDLAQVAAP